MLGKFEAFCVLVLNFIIYSFYCIRVCKARKINIRLLLFTPFHHKICSIYTYIYTILNKIPQQQSLRNIQHRIEEEKRKEKNLSTLVACLFQQHRHEHHYQPTNKRRATTSTTQQQQQQHLNHLTIACHLLHHPPST